MSDGVSTTTKSALDRETLVERIAQAIPPHSFVDQAPWSDTNAVQQERRRDLARALITALDLHEGERRGR